MLQGSIIIIIHYYSVAWRLCRFADEFDENRAVTSSLFAEQLAHLSPAHRLSMAGLFSGPTRASKSLVKAKVEIFSF